MRAQFFGFGSRMSSESNSRAGGSHSGSSGYMRRNHENQFAASQAASEEQGNSSMCSFDGFFINITEEQLNQLNTEEDEKPSPTQSPNRLPKAQRKRADIKTTSKDPSPTSSELNARQ